MGSYLKFGAVVQEVMLFKDTSYLELLQPLCSADWNRLCNFGRRHHEEPFCEIIFNLHQWFRRKCHLKLFIIRSSGSHFIQRSITNCVRIIDGLGLIRLFF